MSFRMKRRGWAIMTVCSLVMVAVGGVWAADNVPDRGRPTGHATTAARTAEGILGEVGCSARHVIADDMYQYPSMREVDCVLRDGAILSASTFTTRAAALQNLATWQLAGSDRWAVVGANWFAVGPRKMVHRISQRFPDATLPTQELPESSAPSDALAARTDCVQSASAFLTSRIAEPERWRNDRPTVDVLYPGLTAVIDSLDIDRAAFDQIGATDTPEFEAWFASFAPAIKDYCRTPPQITSEDLP
ncbi:hypothetical protein [Curtobacterium sp. MCBA15_009]|uniref:hypothetical protein n=1 Tax=Curtobacterium sp. MCBA15_009 TaxID=1898737 RepID=UPI001113A62F|nr:hypothetical protein [Curtobacterium sp. MCBA15_009]